MGKATSADLSRLPTAGTKKFKTIKEMEKEKARREAMRLKSLKEYAAEHPDLHEAVMLSVMHEARNGNTMAQKLYLDRVEGPVKQAVDVTSDGKQLTPTVVILPSNGRDTE